jgi:hypothetical protein
MYAWSDMSKVKKDLWNKLHAFKSSVKDQVTNLAQIMIQHAQRMQKKAMGEQPVMLAQVESINDEQ